MDVTVDCKWSKWRILGAGRAVGRGNTTTAVILRRPLFAHASPSGAAALVQHAANAQDGCWWLRVTRGARGLTAGASGSWSGSARRAAPRPAAKVNIAINKQITACKDVQDLCSVIHNQPRSLAFLQLLRTPRHDVACGTVDQALRALEESALHNIEDFGPQELTNTLHAMAKAKAHYSPTKPLVIEALERRAEALAGTLNAQGVANTLWAYAPMGRAPGAGMMRGLEGRAFC